MGNDTKPNPFGKKEIIAKTKTCINKGSMPKSKTAIVRDSKIVKTGNKQHLKG